MQDATTSPPPGQPGSQARGPAPRNDTGRLIASRRMRARSLRLQTLIRLRWLAIIGQCMALISVYGMLRFQMPIAASFALIVLSTGLNLYLAQRYPNDTQLPDQAAVLVLGFDILQIAGLLALNGGLENPFAVLIAGPVVVGASLLPLRPTILLGVLACCFATMLIFWHAPLPWHEDEPIALPRLYVLGTWLAILCTVVFFGSYVWRVADEAQTLSDALTATELVLARENHLSNLDGLAAAAAHELGTPLATIALVAREMQRDMPAGSDAADIELLNEQVARCRGHPAQDRLARRRGRNPVRQPLPERDHPRGRRPAPRVRHRNQHRAPRRAGCRAGLAPQPRHSLRPGQPDRERGRLRRIARGHHRLMGRQRRRSRHPRRWPRHSHRRAAAAGPPVSERGAATLATRPRRSTARGLGWESSSPRRCWSVPAPASMCATPRHRTAARFSPSGGRRRH